MIRSFLSGSRRHNNQSSRSTATAASAVSREPIHSPSSTEGAFPTADTPLTPKRQQKDEATSSTRNKKKMSLRSKNQTKKKKKKDKKQLEKEPKSPGNNEKRLSPLSLSARRSRKGYRKQPENSESGAFPSLSTSSATTSSLSNRTKKKKTREESKRRGRRARKADKKKPSDASVPNNNTSQQARLQNAPTHRVTPAYPAVPPKPSVKTTPPSPPKLEELPTTPTASLSSSWKNELERTGMYGNQGLQFHPPPYPAKGGDVSSSEDEGAEDLRGLGTNGTILEEDSEACYTSQDEDDDASERDVSLASFSESEYSVTTDNDEDDDDSDTRSLNSSASSALNKYGLIRILDDSESEDEGSAVFVNPRSFDDEEKKEDDLNASLEEELGSVSSRRSRKRILRRHRSRSRSQTRRRRGGDEDKDATQPLLNEAPSSPSRDMNASLLRQFSDDTSSASSLDEAVHRFHDGSFPKQPLMGRTSIETSSSTQETLTGSSNTNIFPTQWLARTMDWMQPSTKGAAKQETKPAPIQVAHDEEQPLLKRSEDSPDAAWRPYDFSMIAPPMSSSSSPPSLKQVSSPVEIFQATSQEQESEVEAPRIKVDKALPQGVRLPDAALVPISPKHLSPKDRDAVLPSFQQPPNQSSPETTATAKSLVVGAMVSSTHTAATESTKRPRRHSRSFSGKRNRQRWLDAMQELSRNEWTTSSTALALGVTPIVLLGVFGNAIASSATTSGILVLCTGSLLNLVCCMAIAWRLNVRRRNDTEQEQRLLQKQDKWQRRLDRKQAQQTDLQSQLLALQAKKRLLERRTQLLQQMQDNNTEIKRRQHEQVVWSTLQILMQHYDQSPTNKRHSPKRSRASRGTSDNASLGSTTGNNSVQSGTSGHISMQSLPARHFTFGNNPSNSSPNNSKRRNRVVSVTPPHLGGQHVHELALDWLAQRWQKIPGVTLKEDSNKDKTKMWNQQKLTVAELLRSTETAVQYKPPRLNNQHGPQDI